MLPYIVSQNGTITAICNGQNYAFDRSSLSYDKVKQALNEQDEAKFLSCIDHDNHFRVRSHGKVTFEDGVIRYNGAKVDNSLSRRILELYEEGFNFHPLVRFLENCYQNPNPTVVDRLYDFLQSRDIMIDNDGYVVGYRRVDPNGWDYYSHTVQYVVGQVAEMPRHKCDENSQNTCSYGLHLGNLNYVHNYCAGQGYILICRAHPKDVTSIPEEPDAPKLRACRLEVLAKYEGEDPKPVYNYEPEDETGCDCGKDGDVYYDGNIAGLWEDDCPSDCWWDWEYDNNDDTADWT